VHINFFKYNVVDPLEAPDPPFKSSNVPWKISNEASKELFPKFWPPIRYNQDTYFYTGQAGKETTGLINTNHMISKRLPKLKRAEFLFQHACGLKFQSPNEVYNFWHRSCAYIQFVTCI
jgi:hypothetical protein